MATNILTIQRLDRASTGTTRLRMESYDPMLKPSNVVWPLYAGLCGINRTTLNATRVCALYTAESRLFEEACVGEFSALISISPFSHPVPLFSLIQSNSLH